MAPLLASATTHMRPSAPFRRVPAAKVAAFAAGRGEAPRPALPPALPAALNYGYILRSRDPARTREHSDLLVDSPLLARVRKLAYDRAPREVRDKLAPAQRFEYNALRAFLTLTDRDDFLALYPHWRPRFLVYGEFLSNLVSQIVHAMRQRSMAPASSEPSMKSPTGQVARALLDHISRHESLTGFPKNTEQIVRDYVTSPAYAYLYLRAIPAAPALPPALPPAAAPPSAPPAAAPPSHPQPSPPAVFLLTRCHRWTPAWVVATLHGAPSLPAITVPTG